MQWVLPSIFLKIFLQISISAKIIGKKTGRNVEYILKFSVLGSLSQKKQCPIDITLCCETMTYFRKLIKKCLFGVSGHPKIWSWKIQTFETYYGPETLFGAYCYPLNVQQGLNKLGVITIYVDR